MADSHDVVEEEGLFERDSQLIARFVERMAWTLVNLVARQTKTLPQIVWSDPELTRLGCSSVAIESWYTCARG